jgi:hypothetical protein
LLFPSHCIIAFPLVIYNIRTTIVKSDFVPYLTSVLHPICALSVFTDWWQFYRLLRHLSHEPIHATCILMSKGVSLVKPSLLRFRALQFLSYRICQLARNFFTLWLFCNALAVFLLMLGLTDAFGIANEVTISQNLSICTFGLIFKFVTCRCISIL